MLRLVVLAAFLPMCFCFFGFRSEIPNGDKVPNPCNRADTWGGVGHTAVGGAGERNQFGIDFANANYIWTKQLCQMDSDGDGMTNGQELGDPSCRWSATSPTMLRTKNLSHPGVCEPFGKSECAGKNNFLKLTKVNGKFVCNLV